MSPSNRFLVMLNVLFFMALIGVVLYFQTATAEQQKYQEVYNIKGL